MIHRLLGSELITWKYIRTEQTIALLGVSCIILLTLCLYLAAKCIHSQVVSTSDIQIQVFWTQDLPEGQVRKAWERSAQITGIDRVTTYSSAQALHSMQETLGSEIDLSWMQDHNPLPPTAILYASISQANSAGEILAQVHNLPGVERVHTNPLQMQSAEAWSALATTVVWPVMCILLAIQAVLLANTVRMSMTKLHADIDVLRLVGAARWAYLAPILTRMILLTLAGTTLALAGAKLIQVRVQEILASPPLHLECPFLSWPELGAAFLGAGLVSGLSCTLAIYWQDEA